MSGTAKCKDGSAVETVEQNGDRGIYPGRQRDVERQHRRNRIWFGWGVGNDFTNDLEREEAGQRETNRGISPGPNEDILPFVFHFANYSSPDAPQPLEFGGRSSEPGERQGVPYNKL